MTLRLDIDYFQPAGEIKKELLLRVIGSKAGPLQSSPSLSAEEIKWDPRFRVDCSQYDDLLFTLFALEKTGQAEIGRTNLHCFGFIEEEKEKKNLPSKIPVKYQLTFKNEVTLIGSLYFWVTYDPALLFEGEISCKPVLDLRIGKTSQMSRASKDIPRDSRIEDIRADKKPADVKSSLSSHKVESSDHNDGSRMSHNSRIVSVLRGKYPQNDGKGVDIYMGKCPTVNMFSFFDEAVNGQKCSLAEDIYRDKS